jgi:hypothetical protein
MSINLKEGTRLQLQRRFCQTAPICNLRQIVHIYPTWQSLDKFFLDFVPSFYVTTFFCLCVISVWLFGLSGVYCNFFFLFLFIYLFLQEHKLIRPSRRAVLEHGRAHVQQIMGMRTREILNQVTLQLRFKSANRSFQATKQALEQTVQQLSPAA